MFHHHIGPGKIQYLKEVHIKNKIVAKHRCYIKTFCNIFKLERYQMKGEELVAFVEDTLTEYIFQNYQLNYQQSIKINDP